MTNNVYHEIFISPIVSIPHMGNGSNPSTPGEPGEPVSIPHMGNGRVYRSRINRAEAHARINPPYGEW